MKVLGTRVATMNEICTIFQIVTGRILEPFTRVQYVVDQKCILFRREHVRYRRELSLQRWWALVALAVALMQLIRRALVG